MATQVSARLDRTTSPEQVAAHLRRQILAGELATGARVHQGDVADQLGVSRIPVREAILILDREGWVHLEPQRGARVTGLTPDDIRDHYDLRSLVFGLIGRRVAEAPSDELAGAIDDLAAIHADMLGAADLVDFAAANDAFIARVVRAARSPRLAAALHVTPAIVREGFFDVVPDGRGIQEAGTARLLQALRARSVDGADTALQDMLVAQGRAVQAAMARPTAAPADHAPRPPRPSRPDETAADAAARYVRAAIFDGRLVAGQRLPQDDIAAAIGASRIPVREALIVLEREGWIRTRPHRGSFVNALDDVAVRDRFALYGRFYGFAARRLIERSAPLDDLRAIAAELVRTTDPTTFERVNTVYMSTLVTLSGSDRLRGVLRSTTQIVPGPFFMAVPRSIAVQRRGVRQLQQTIDHGDAAAAMCVSEQMEARHAAEVIRVMRVQRRGATATSPT